MKKEKIEELYGEHVTELIDAYDRYGDVYEYWSMRLEDFTQAINQSELEWYKELSIKLEFIYGSDLKVFGAIIDKNASDYYKEIQNKIKELEK